MKILTILGARPQFIKASALSREFKKHTEIEEFFVYGDTNSTLAGALAEPASKQSKLINDYRFELILCTESDFFENSDSGLKIMLNVNHKIWNFGQ